MSKNVMKAKRTRLMRPSKFQAGAAALAEAGPEQQLASSLSSRLDPDRPLRGSIGSLSPLFSVRPDRPSLPRRPPPRPTSKKCLYTSLRSITR